MEIHIQWKLSNLDIISVTLFVTLSLTIPFKVHVCNTDIMEHIRKWPVYRGVLLANAKLSTYDLLAHLE